MSKKTTTTGETTSSFEIFHVTYQPQVAGQEGVYGPESLIIVSTPNGERDAIAACKQYHGERCKIVSTQSYMEVLADVKRFYKEEQPKEKKGK